MLKSATTAIIIALAAFTTTVAAKEYPIGKPKMIGGMEVAAVYLQPIEMDPHRFFRMRVVTCARLS